MVQSIPNWAEVQGTITKLHPDPKSDDFVVAHLDVADVKPVGSFQNMFKSAVGTTIAVSVPRLAAEEAALSPGKDVTWQIRRGGPDSVFVDPNSIG